MSSIGTNLLLLHGHIHDPELVRRLANVPPAPPPSRRSDKRRRVYSRLVALASLYRCASGWARAAGPEKWTHEVG